VAKAPLPPLDGLHDATPHEGEGVAVEVVDGAVRVRIVRDGGRRRVRVRLG